MKVIVLAHDFPPNTTVAAMRVISWLKYAKHVEYTVITRHWPENLANTSQYYEEDQLGFKQEKLHGHTVHYVPFKPSFFDKVNAFFTTKGWSILRKATTFLSQLLMWKRLFNYELGFLYHYADDYLKDHAHEYDVILASGEPFILFKYAHQLSLKHRKKWIADYRDSWSEDPSLDQGALYRFLINYRRGFETQFLASSTLAIAPAQSIIDSIPTKNSHLVENGVDLELFDSVEAKEINEFSLLVTGTIYEGHDVQSFLAACIRFYQQHNQPKAFKVKFMGINYRPNPTVAYINETAEKYPFIKILPRATQKEAIAAQKSSYILFKFSFQKPMNGFYGARLYEYVSTGRPILNIVDSPEKKETDFFPNAQTMVSGEAEICAYLNQKYQEYHEGIREFNLMNEQDKYSISREYNTDKLEQILTKAVSVI